VDKAQAAKYGGWLANTTYYICHNINIMPIITRLIYRCEESHSLQE